MSKRQQKEPISAQETIEQFVLRARRVQAHSLVKNGTVGEYAKAKMTVSFTPATGITTTTDHVVPDEEVFESLATRLRPFELEREPIYLPDVFKAIRACVPPESISEDRHLEECLVSAENWFEHRCLKQDSVAYAVQLIDSEDNSETKYLSDVTLANSWLYTDTVHADPKGDKAEGRKLGYRERYKAASSFFSEFALFVVSLLNIVKALCDRGLLQISESAWTEPVTCEEADKEAGERIVEGSIYVFPVGTEVTTGNSPENIPGGTTLTPMLMKLLGDPEGRAVLNVLGEDETPVASYIAYRGLIENTFVFLVSDVLIITIPIDVLSGHTDTLPELAAVRGREEEAFSLFKSIESPHCAEIQFFYSNKQQAIKIKFEASLDEKGKQKSEVGTV